MLAGLNRDDLNNPAGAPVARSFQPMGHEFETASGSSPPPSKATGAEPFTERPATICPLATPPRGVGTLRFGA